MFSDKIKIILMIIGILIVLSGVYTLFSSSDQTNTAIDQPSNNEQRLKNSSNIELEKNTLFNGKISMLIPKTFVLMSEEEIKQANSELEYVPVIYTNQEGTINIVANLTSNMITPEDITSLKDEITNNLDQIHQSAELLGDEIADINGKTVGIIELTSSGEYTEIYSLMFFTDVEEKLLTINISMPKNQMEEWQPIAKQIMNSLKTN